MRVCELTATLKNLCHVCSVCAGKNRPLDEDELDFVNAVERSKAAAERAWRDEQDREMDSFREVRLDIRNGCLLV